MRISLLCWLMLLLPSLAAAQAIIHLEAEPLPDLNIPRAGHTLFYADGVTIHFK